MSLLMFQIDEKIFVLEHEFEFCFQIDEKIFVLESEFDVYTNPLGLQRNPYSEYIINCVVLDDLFL